LNAKIHRTLQLIVALLFCAFVGISAEANTQNRHAQQSTSTKQEQLTQHDGREAMHLAIENNSRFVAPPLVARVASASVRIISARNLTTHDNVSIEQRAGVNFSNHNLKAGHDTRLYRLSPSKFRTKYIYSLRRIII
jgi:hypothetical protein